MHHRPRRLSALKQLTRGPAQQLLAKSTDKDKTLMSIAVDHVLKHDARHGVGDLLQHAVALAQCLFGRQSRADIVDGEHHALQCTTRLA